MEQTLQPGKNQKWFDKNYRFLMLIPLIFVILSLIYLGIFYSNTGSFILKDVSLSGGTTITLHQDNLDYDALERELASQDSDLSFRRLTDLRSGKAVAFIIESSATQEELTNLIESVLGFPLNEENSSIEFTGANLSENFYRQLIFALIASFILMSVVILILFRTLIPSIAVIFAALSDIIIPLALIDFLGIKLSAAGIAAFLMLIGYSVDTDILLTTRALDPKKRQEGYLNQRIFRAFKTGILMTSTALIAILPAFFIVTGLPESFKQIFLIVGLGLFADIFNTWLTNVGIIKWYCESKGIS